MTRPDDTAELETAALTWKRERDEAWRVMRVAGTMLLNAALLLDRTRMAEYVREVVEILSEETNRE